MRLSSGAAAVSAAAALLLFPAPAFADGPPVLAVKLAQHTEIRVSPTGATPHFEIENTSDTTATGVTLTVSVADLAPGVNLDGVGPGCAETDAVTVRCTLPDLVGSGGGFAYVEPVSLVAPQASAVTPAGSLTITLDSAESSAISKTFPVHTTLRGTDMALKVPSRVGPHGLYTNLPLTVVNFGLARERTKQFTITIPQGIGILDLNADPNCRYLGGTAVEQSHFGPVTVVCPLDVDLDPNAQYDLEESGGDLSRFILLLDKRTPGPLTYRGKATLETVNPDDDPSNNTGTFTTDAAANKLDVTVRAQPTTDSVTWTATDKGPSAATGWTADLVAPAGTTFRRTPGCQAPSATTLHCTSTDWIPPGASVSRTVRLDGTPTAGAAGSVTISGTGPSTETHPADNKAGFTLGSGTATGGQGGGGLPITGPSAVGGAVGAVGVVLFGVLLLFAGRRRSAH